MIRIVIEHVEQWNSRTEFFEYSVRITRSDGREGRYTIDNDGNPALVDGRPAMPGLSKGRRRVLEAARRVLRDGRTRVVRLP